MRNAVAGGALHDCVGESWSGRSWNRWLDLTPRTGAWNMALDQALLDRAARNGECRLRLYRWSPSCLSFGRHEPATRRYDRSRIAALGLHTVRRPTGGRAVWHAGELTYAVAMPAPGVAAIREAYLEIHRMLGAALCSLGIRATLAPASATPGIAEGACFARPVGGEILVRGRKVVGSAQVREAGGLLQHGSILLDDDQTVVRLVSQGQAPGDGSTPLSTLIGGPVSAHAVADAIAEEAAARWGGRWSDSGEQAELIASARAHLPRFASEDWTWRA